jgi:hypothetical protein
VLEGKPLFKDGREQVTAKRNGPLALVSYITFQLHGIDLTLSEYGWFLHFVDYLEKIFAKIDRFLSIKAPSGGTGRFCHGFDAF